jgi:acyl-CoA synthetase (AMP-forming)/AMP-acid ligase II
MVFTSPHADIALPAGPFHEDVLYRAAEAKEQPVFITAENGRSFSYKDLLRDTYRCAGALVAHGLRKGDVFALLLPNLQEFAVAFYGGLAAGGVITPVNPLYTDDEIARQLLDSGARYVLTVPPLLEKVASAAHQGVREIFVVGEADGTTSFRNLLESNCEPPSVSICAREDVAVLPYSSGTSGNPKGVMLTHANLTAGVHPASAQSHTGRALWNSGYCPFFTLQDWFAFCTLQSEPAIPWSCFRDSNRKAFYGQFRTTEFNQDYSFLQYWPPWRSILWLKTSIYPVCNSWALGLRRLVQICSVSAAIVFNVPLFKVTA